MAIENNTEESAESTSSSVTPLTTLFDSRASEPDEHSSSADDTGEDKKEKEEASQKLPESEVSPEKKAGNELEEKEKQTSEKSDKKADTKADVKKEGEPSPEAKAATEAKAKWEGEDNPYVKRYKDTAANWQKEHQEKLQYQNAVSQLQQEVQVLRKIADGTYDPEVDNPAKSITPEKVAAEALYVGKALASKTAAVEQHGRDVVESRLAQFHEKFGQNQIVQSLVMESESPVHEAFRILDRLDFETKYGSSPADIYKNIRAEVEKELTPKLKEQLAAEIIGRADKKKTTPQGLSSSRGSNGLNPGQNSKGKGPTPLGELFQR